jgi:hypothetical protein
MRELIAEAASWVRNGPFSPSNDRRVHIWQGSAGGVGEGAGGGSGRAASPARPGDQGPEGGDRLVVVRVVVMMMSTRIAGSSFDTTFVLNFDSRKPIVAVSVVSAPL